jgi:hypothetical protein
LLIFSSTLQQSLSDVWLNRKYTLGPIVNEFIALEGDIGNAYIQALAQIPNAPAVPYAMNGIQNNTTTNGITNGVHGVNDVTLPTNGTTLHDVPLHNVNQMNNNNVNQLNNTNVPAPPAPAPAPPGVVRIHSIPTPAAVPFAPAPAPSPILASNSNTDPDFHSTVSFAPDRITYLPDEHRNEYKQEQKTNYNDAPIYPVQSYEGKVDANEQQQKNNNPNSIRKDEQKQWYGAGQETKQQEYV